MFIKKEYMKKYRKTHKKQISLTEKLRYLRNRNKIRRRVKNYYLKNKQKCLNRMKIYNIKNKQKLSKQKRMYRIKHKYERNKFLKEKRKKDVGFKILCNLRANLSTALKRNTKYGSTIDLLGCSIQLLKVHLQKHFTKGMNWFNYGKWEIDHIRPCSSFNLSKPEEQKKCFHYTNLQPLWEIDNLVKRDKLFWRKNEEYKTNN